MKPGTCSFTSFGSTLCLFLFLIGHLLYHFFSTLEPDTILKPLAQTSSHPSPCGLWYCLLDSLQTGHTWLNLLPLAPELQLKWLAIPPPKQSLSAGSIFYPLLSCCVTLESGFNSLFFLLSVMCYCKQTFMFWP